ncbi:hypothetical protein [Melittangium boletus]|uniref:Lipoprotein n=1 Tax=Melittangium boletus DSM 14713 TaxID=1294270 RepID=A0A250I9N9_9BACT|nr:hypothetical protein [Melittangium boletus]ATB27872.1 hypothetical protein MEBOL_001317 [Melittangium boletus DSM 14713]
MKTRHWVVLASSLLALTRCGTGSTSPTPDTGTGGDPPAEDVDTSDLTYKPCDASVRLGQFTVENLDGYTAVQGRVLNGVVPSTVRNVEAQEGQCRLLRGRALFCNPACGSSQTCGENGVCIPYPTSQNVGTVNVAGLKVPLSMTPNSARFYSSSSTSMPFPGFDTGASIQLSASGADLPAFTLLGQGVDALTVAASDIVIEKGKPVPLSWTPSTSASPARISILLDLAHHGGIAASVECDGIEDTGSFSLPAGLVSKLIDVGVAGFPKITLSRRTADSAELTSGCVDLLVQSQVSREVVIPGLVSCSTDEDCPTGQTCQADLTCGGTSTPPTETPDSGTPDSGTPIEVPDSGTPTETPDSGTPIETPDSGTPDSGTVPTTPFSFFVTSIESMRQLSGSANGFGGDLRFGELTGLAGADKICRTIAEMSLPGAGLKTWRAFLSASTGGTGGAAVNAIDRIGEGPWYDRTGRLVAPDKASLLSSARPVGGDATIKNDLPNERGEPNHQGVDNHDVLTGSSKQGKFSGTRANTCNDWTSAVGSTGKPNCGHSWPRNGSTSGSGAYWLSDHTVPGCAPGVNLVDNGGGTGNTVGSSGGYGAIYCFALTP